MRSISSKLNKKTISKNIVFNQVIHFFSGFYQQKTTLLRWLYFAIYLFFSDPNMVIESASSAQIWWSQDLRCFSCKLLYTGEGRRDSSNPSPQKGGNPSAPSSTDTLLRLSPHRQPRRSRAALVNQLRSPASGAADFAGLTGSVCKERERIHRNLLICDYYRFRLHEGEFQPSI